MRPWYITERKYVPTPPTGKKLGFVSESKGYLSSELTFECTDVRTVGLCDTAVRDVRLLVVRETPVPKRGPLRRRYPMAYQYSNSVCSTQAADNRN